MFDPSDLRLLLNSEAMVHAMGLFRSLQALTNPAASCELVHMPFLRGECAFTVKWSEQFKVGRLGRGGWSGNGSKPRPSYQGYLLDL